MDPNCCLAVIRQAIIDFEAATDSAEQIAAAVDIIEQFEFLDEWLQQGGSLPTQWNR